MKNINSNTLADTKKNNIYPNVLSLIGSTPILRLSNYLDNGDIELLIKMESANPGGSAKDRPAKHMIEQALKSGKINRETVIIESTSGNMGIGLAQVCKFYNLDLICVVDENAQQQNLKIMKALGASIHMIETPINGDFLTARIAAVKQLLLKYTNAFWTNQYANYDNPDAHTKGTISEIFKTLGDTIDYIYIATSTTGTLLGCKNYLNKINSNTKIIPVDSQGSCLFDGKSGSRKIPGMGAGRVPELAINEVYDNVEKVSDMDCVIGCRRAVSREALLVGGSAGGVLEAVRRRLLNSSHVFKHKRILAVLHDSGTRYIDTVFNDEWVSETLNISVMDFNQLVLKNA